jgi:hypothetical protein
VILTPISDQWFWWHTVENGVAERGQVIVFMHGLFREKPVWQPRYSDRATIVAHAWVWESGLYGLESTCLNGLPTLAAFLVRWPVGLTLVQ